MLKILNPKLEIEQVSGKLIFNSVLTRLNAREGYTVTGLSFIWGKSLENIPYRGACVLLTHKNCSST
jgi:hypothetical protein